MVHIYTRFKQLVFLLCCGLLWQSCNVINPAEQVPTYIHIDSFHFKGNPLWPDLSYSQITDVVVYYNSNPIGSFDLPCTFPVLATGTGTLSVAPGINVDGMNNLTGAYPFYTLDTFTFAAQPGKIIDYTPVTTYYNNFKPVKLSDFSGNTNFAQDGGNIGMTTIYGPDSVLLSGSGSAGCIQLNAVGDSSVDSSIASFAIPAGAAYIEFEYKSTMPFSIGLQSNLATGLSSAPYYLAGIYPSLYWQKFYLSVTDFAAQYPGVSYNFFIMAGPNTISGRLLIDNIYLITF